MTLGRDGSLSAGRFQANANSNRTSLFLRQAGTGPLILAYGPDGSIPKVTVENTGDTLFRGAVTANGFNNSSDRNLKKNISSVNAQAILEKVVALPISRWSYTSDAASTAHIGPMAQDFHAAFGLNGTDDKHINTIDEGGVALAAIQGLYELNRQPKNENKALQERLAALERAFEPERARAASGRPGSTVAGSSDLEAFTLSATRFNGTMPPAGIYPGDGKWPYLNAPYLSILEKNNVIRVYSERFSQTPRAGRSPFPERVEGGIRWLQWGRALRLR